MSLRHWEEGDVPALVRALQDGDVARWVLQIPWPYTDHHARSFVRMAARDRATGKAAHLAVVAGAGVAGSVALTSIDWDNRSAELGYWTATERGHLRTSTGRRDSLLFGLLADDG